MRTILIVVAAIVGIIIANWLFWHLLGVLTLGFFVLLWLAFLAACCFGLFMLIRALIGSKKPKEVQENQRATQYKLWTVNHPTVLMHKTQPSSQQALLLELNAGETLNSADIVEIPIDTKVTILEDTGKDCVKVRLQGKGFPQNTGWVARGSLIKETV